MKKMVFILSALAVLLCASSAPAADIILTTPDKDGGPGVLAAIASRSSAEQKPFAKTELTTKELTTILWAATGRNREKNGWTVPMAMGQAPYVSVYVLLKDGSYVYDWDKNILKLVNDKSAIAKAGQQGFVGTAPCVLVFATAGSLRIDNWGEIAAGAMSQNVYLAAGAFGLKTRYIQSFNKMSLIDALHIGPLSRIIAIMPVGRQ